MSYCKKNQNETTVYNCLACKFCLPPAKRINGRMCNYEEMKEKITITYSDKENRSHKHKLIIKK